MSFIIAVFFIGGFFLCGFRTADSKPYFTIYYEGVNGQECITVTDKLLRGAWYNTESQKKFAGGKSLFERAAETAAESAQKAVRSKFPELWLLVQKIRRGIDHRPFDGNINFSPQAGHSPVREGIIITNGDPRFWVTGARAGCILDTEKLCRDILDVLKSGVYGDIVAKIKTIKPSSENDILGRIGLRGGYTTYFEENPARMANIARSLACFNGLVVPNGESVSFNRTVGPRTAARGYEEAKIIINGEFVPGVGGGVCQASTTLFNAALLAGMTITESHNHSLAVGYVPIGRDAMVSSSADLEFTNNSGGTIYIEAAVMDNRAFVRIYGNKTAVKYRPRTEVKEFELGDDEIDPARESLTYIETFKDDRLVHSKLVRKSKYKAMKPKSETPAA